MKSPVFPALLALGICAHFSSHAGTPEWPRFRGPNGSGLGAGLQLAEPLGEKAILWRVKLPAEGHSSPVISGDRIFLTCADKPTGRRILMCASAKDGSIAWNKEFNGPVFREHADNSFAAPTPAIDSERVYLCSMTPEGSWMAAFDQKDGRELWRKELGPYASQHGPGVSPLVWEDLVILDFDQDKPKSFVAAFDAKTGAERWRWEKPGDKHSSSTPCIFTPKNGAPQVITISYTAGLTGLDARTGKVAWQLPDLVKKRCVASPIVTDAGIVVGQCGEGAAESFVYAVKPAADGKSAEKLYEVIRTGGYVPTPVAVGEHMFLWKENGLVTCIKIADNTQVWSERVQGPFYASPIAADGKLYNVTRRGDLVVLAAGAQFKELARMPLGEASHATPAIAGGRMYLRTFSHLMALGK